MTIATVMVYVDPAQQAEEQVRVARELANRFWCLGYRRFGPRRATARRGGRRGH